MVSLQELRDDIKDLYNTYIEDKQRLISHLDDLLDILSSNSDINLDKESYDSYRKTNKDAVNYDIYRQRISQIIYSVRLDRYYLKTSHIDLDDDNNKNKALSIYYNLHYHNDIIDEIYSIYGDYFKKP
jgi:hypothetical protein